jgi:hypothetical protein
MAMKPRFALILLLTVGYALPSRALRLEVQPNPTSQPVAAVDIEDENHIVVAHLFVLPGETMKLNPVDQTPVAGAGYYEAMPGEDYLLVIPANLEFPRLGGESCPCTLHMNKIGWTRLGVFSTIEGLRPFLETSTGKKIPIVSDVAHPRMAQGRLYFRLKGHSSENWVLTRYGQVVDTGGPWGLWEIARFFLTVVLPLVLLGVFGYTLAGAIYFLRQDTHPNESFLQLMLLSFMRLPLASRMRREAAIIPSIREQETGTASPAEPVTETAGDPPAADI